MWHIDGHHKLIRWRMVTHGGIDGYSRLPVYLKCSTNNKAQTVAESFTQAMHQYGIPKKVCADMGGENVIVANIMMQHPQRGVGTFITGRSVHNQRIERFWRDVHTGCTSTFYNLFYKMEDLGLLNTDCEKDMFALQYTFLPIINNGLEKFRHSFSRHKLRTEKNRSPMQLWRSAFNDIEWFVENDLPENLRHQENELNVDRILVPNELDLTNVQLERIADDFPYAVRELASEEEQITYFSSLKEFLNTM
ncbi:uncharacterized protein LOC117103393 [Anneissia japonica]|uniref:uncharacterized protein LOC117103393 n=1 Tax=Anneissia japonica TaxID=1529436 RepID=UPI001425A9F0|nr:uncharacterized protein LOC117103393 [Anneissia japonica]